MSKFTIKLSDGKRWTIQRGPYMTVNDGTCDWSNCTIKISNHRRLRSEFGTMVHEVIHALQPYLNEDTVKDIEKDLTKVLFDKLGARIKWPK